MSLTLRSASTTTATTKGAALTHAQMDANWLHSLQSANQEFSPSGAGASAESVQVALRRMVWAEQYGASSSATAAVNTASIQEALTEVGSGRSGGTVLITTPGTYLLASAGTNPYQAGKQYCLNMAYDNVTLHIGPGVILKLADAQQTDAGGNVNIIAFGDRSNLTITGGGSIDGNAAGQSGWTGGRLQTDGGLIVGHPTNGCSNVRIERLTLRNSLSNAIWLRAGNANSTYFYLDKLRVFACGEGPVVENVTFLWMTDIYIDDTTDVMVGDGLEPSDCDYVVMDRLIFNAAGAVSNPGSAIDLFGVRWGTVTNFIIKDWAGIGIDINKSSDGATPTELVIGPGVMEGVDYGVALRGGTLNNVKLTSISMDGGNAGTDGIQVGSDDADTTGPVTIENCSARRFGRCGLLIKTVKDITVNGGQYNDNTAAGVRWLLVASGVIDGDVADIVINGVTATGNGAGGISFLTQTFAARPTGSVTDCYLAGNTGGPIVTDDLPSGLENIYVADIYPSFAPPDQTFTPTLLSGGAAVGRTYADQIGRYRIIDGARCWFQIKVFLSAKGTSTGNTTIAGLPFTARASPSGNSFPLTIFPYEVTYSGQIGGTVQSGQQTITVYNITSTGGLDSLQDTGLANDSAFFVEGTYEIDNSAVLP